MPDPKHQAITFEDLDLSSFGSTDAEWREIKKKLAQSEADSIIRLKALKEVVDRLAPLLDRNHPETFCKCTDEGLMQNVACALCIEVERFSRGITK